MKLFYTLCAFMALASAGLPPYFQSPASRSHPLAKLPVRFESAGNGKYVARGPNFALSISAAESRLSWIDTRASKRAEVRTRLVGASSIARLEPVGSIPGEVNYFTGAPSGWRTDVHLSEKVRCSEAYPGIDMVFHGNPGELEYDFVVKPHADPSLIRMGLSGQQSLSVDHNGDLVIATTAGEIRWKHPDIYQDIEGVRRHVDGKFAISGGMVRFKTGAYDRGHELVIDPTLAYSTYLGGSANEESKGIAVDAAGNVYIVGQTNSPDLAVVSAFQNSLAGQSAGLGMSGDAFIAKFNPAGALVYLTYLGGTGADCAAAVAVDAAGNAYIAGYTTSSDFPIAGLNPLQSHYGGSGGPAWYHAGDAFVTKLNPSGNKLIYSTYLGGSSDDAATAIVVDKAGDAYVAGSASSINFPTTAGAYQTSFKGGGGEPYEPAYSAPFIDPGDAFVAELDPSGSKLLMSTFVGGGYDDIAVALALDSSANIYIAGYTMSPNFPTTTGALQTAWGGAEQQTPYFVTGDGFITKLNPTGSALVYSTYFGGSGDECITAIAVDATGSVYFTGFSSTMNLPTTAGAAQSKYAGYQVLPFLIEYLFGDAIVGKLNPAGSQLSYLTYLGGSTNDAGLAIAVDSSGNAFVAGFTDSPDFPLTASAYQKKMAGDNGPTPPYLLFGDGFLAEVNPTGTAFSYSTYLGGRGDDMFEGIALDGAGQVYLTGNSVSVDWPVTSKAAQPAFGGYNANGWPWGDAVYSVFSGFTSTPAITKVANAEGESAAIAANTWVEIKGSGLAPDTRTWQSLDFVNGQMPTALDGVTVTFNGQSAYVYYISPTQINVLTPATLLASQPAVVVTVNGLVSSAFTATVQQSSPSFFVINGGPYVLATHLSGTLIGPAALYPGVSTPAAAGETIVIYANGFGPVSPPVVAGSAVQTGNLPALPVIRIGTTTANVRFAGLVSPGLYQFNVDVPAGTASGDIAISATLNGTTQAGTLITIK